MVAALLVALALSQNPPEPRFLAPIGDRWGYLDASGAMVVPATWYEAKPFSGGLAAVRGDDGWVAIDVSGKVVPGSMPQPRACPSNLCVMAVPRTPGSLLTLSGYADPSGTVVIAPRFYAAEPFSEGLAVVSVGKSLAVIDQNGTQKVTLPIGVTAARFSEGLAWACQQPNGRSLCGFIDATGAWKIRPRFRDVGDFSQGIATFVGDDGRSGFVNREGKEVLGRWGRVQPFSEGLAAVSSTGREALCTAVGNQPDCVDAVPGKWGFIDSSGKRVVPQTYEAVENFRDGLAHVTLHTKWMYIDKTGRVVFDPGQLRSGSAEPEGALTPEALAAMSLEDLKLLRNEIFARHGYVFKTPAMADHFAKQPWYQPDPSFTEDRLSPVEKQNVALIRKLEAAKGAKP